MPYLYNRIACLCALLVAAVAPGASAAENEAQPLGWALPETSAQVGRIAFAAQDWAAADDALLDTLRGGYDFRSVAPGLAVSFGFARTVRINGEQVSELRFNLPDLSQVTVEQAKQLTDALSHTQWVQNGLGNSTTNSTMPGGLAAAATFVQNSLNNQRIQTLTQIDAGVNSLGLLRSISTQGALRDALMGAVGAR